MKQEIAYLINKYNLKFSEMYLEKFCKTRRYIIFYDNDEIPFKKDFFVTLKIVKDEFYNPTYISFKMNDYREFDDNGKVLEYEKV